MLETPLGKLDEKSVWNVTWQCEGAIVLAWALRLAELPAYDEQVSVDLLYEIGLRPEVAALVSSLRTREEMEALDFQMLAIHWRLRQYSLEGKAMDFVAFAPTAWCGPMDLSLARLIDNDLEVNGARIDESPEPAWRIAAGIMQERRQAVEWLLGGDALYSLNLANT